MLTKKEYDDLWYDTFDKLSIAKSEKWIDYCERECYFQDYLDLFRGLNTRPRYSKDTDDKEVKCCDGEHTYLKTDINGNEKSLWDILKDGIKDKIDVNSEFGKKLKQTGFPKIKYILIGEAPSKPAKVRSDLSIKDQAKVGIGKKYPIVYNCNTYFYNIEQYKPTTYFNAAYKAIVGVKSTHIKPKEKREELIKLANNGIILLDLFPFAIDYDKIRDNIIDEHYAIDYWENVKNSYSVINRIKIYDDLIEKNANVCFIAPPKISNHLAINTIARMKFKLNLKIDTDLELVPPKFKSVGLDMGNNPNAIEIKKALGLP